MLEYDIADKEFDFSGAGNELDRYCLQNDISSRTKYLIRLAAEEIIQQILIPHGGTFPMHVLIEYTEVERNAIVTVSYSGARFDPAAKEGMLSYDMLRGSVDDIQYKYDLEAELPNTVTVFISEESARPEKKL